MLSRGPPRRMRARKGFELWRDDNGRAGYLYMDERGFVVEMCRGSVRILCGVRLGWISECWIEVMNDSSKIAKKSSVIQYLFVSAA